MKKLKLKKIISLATTASLFFTMIIGSDIYEVKGEEISKDALKNLISEKSLEYAKESSNYIKGNELLKENISENKNNENPEEEIRVIVQLKAAPAVKVEKDEYTSSVKKKEEKLIKSQSSIVGEVEKITGTKVKRNFGYLVNGFSINTKRKNVDKIRAIDGVKSVSEVRVSYPDMEFAKKITDTASVWNDLGYKGEGMVVSIIDTGIDYTHKDLKITDESKAKLDKDEINKDVNSLSYGKYFTSKIPYGYNYADDNENIIDDGSQHGMHVAGIVAANGSDEECSTLAAVKGVAPEAQLLAMKVFSNNTANSGAYDDDIIKAIEDSVKLGADVINMSLGSDSGFTNPDDPQHVAVKNATDAGTICVISAGNSQTCTTTSGWNQPENRLRLKDTATIGSPSTAKDSLSVASMENTTLTEKNLKYEVENGEKGDCAFSLVSGSDLSTLKEYHDIVDCGVGSTKDFEGKDVAGKIALIKRGDITFDEKYVNAVANKAAALIIYNHEAGGDELISMSITSEVTVPVFSVGNTSGKTLIEKTNNGAAKIKFDGTSISTAKNSDEYDMSQYSSWGATPNLEFKPEITAPGGDIYSLANENSYQTMSGTSMSSPFVAGSEALIIQGIKEKNWNVKDKDLVSLAKNSAMNTATELIDKYDKSKKVPYSARRQGAGLINPKNAIKNNVIVTGEDGKASLALKEVDNSTKFTLTLKNYGDKDKTYNLSEEEVYSELTDENGNVHEVILDNSNVTFDKKSVTVKANSTAKVTGTLTISKDADKDNFVEGYVHFTATDDDTPSLSVPFMGFYGDWSDESIIDAPNYTDSNDSLLGTTGLGQKTSKGFSYYGTTIVNGDMRIDKEKTAFSPNGDNSKDTVTPFLYALRNSKERKVQVVDENNKVIRDLSKDLYVRKNTVEDYISGTSGTVVSSATWDGTVYNKSKGKYEKVKDGKYYIRVTNSVELENAKEQTLDMPVKVDTVAPKVKIQGIEQYKDAEGKIKYRISWTEEDKDGSGLMPMAVVVAGNKTTSLDEDEITKVNGQCYADIDMEDGEVNEVSMAIIDNAGNTSVDSGKFKAGELKTLALSNLKTDTIVIGENALTNGKFVIKGTASDNVSKLLINEERVSVKDNYFNYPVSVNEGENSIKIYAENKNGDVILDKTYKVILDTIAPVITTTPELGSETPYYTTDKDKLTIKVKVSDDTNVDANIVTSSGTKAITLDKNGEGSIDVDLTAGMNAFNIVARDAGNNTTIKEIVVVNTGDDSKLKVEVDNLDSFSILNGDYIENDVYTIEGHLNKKAKEFKINGQDVKVNKDLTFSYSVKLNQGTNRIRFYAVDDDDTVVMNYAYRVLYDSKAPNVVLDLPLAKEDNNIYTNNKDFKVSGKISDNLYGYSLSINGDTILTVDKFPVQDSSVLEKEFSKVINLDEGKNSITVEAVDQFGNEVSDTISVVLDTVAPEKPSINVKNDKKAAKVKIDTTEKQVEKIEYSFDGVNYYEYNGEFSVEKTSDIYARVTDYAGNVSEVAKTHVDIDTTAPVVTVSGVEDGEVYYTAVQPKVDVDDKDAEVHVTLNGKEYKGEKIDVAGKYTLEAYAIDKTGNKSDVAKVEFSLVQSSTESKYRDKIIVNGNDVKQPNPYVIFNASSGENLEVNLYTATLTDENKGIFIDSNDTRVTIPKKILDDNKSKKLVFRQSIYENSDLLDNIKSVGKIYEMSLLTKDGKAITDFGDSKVKVSITLTEDQLKDLNTNKLAAYYYNEDKKSWEKIDGGVFNNGSSRFEFETNHFTKFTIIEENKDEDKVVNTNNNKATSSGNTTIDKVLTKTGTAASKEVMMTLSAILSAVGVLLLRKNK